MVKQRASVLIVDDDPNVRMLLIKLLGNSRYEIFEAGTLDEAQNIFLEQIPNITFLDISLDHESGFEFLEWKNSNPAYHNNSVIIMSAYAFTDNVKTAIGLGANDFIAKPLINTVVDRKTRKALLTQKNNKEELSFVTSLEVTCTIDFKPIKNEKNILIIESDARFPDDLLIQVSLGDDPLPYTKVGKTMVSGSGKILSALALQGDIPEEKPRYSNKYTYGEEDMLVEHCPKIYILDDDENFIELMHSFFEKHHSEVTSFTKVSKFMSKVSEEPPDICIVDLTINSLNDSFVTIRDLRMMYPDLPILIATANVGGSAVSHAIEIGGSDYVYKPVKRNTLLHKVMRLISEEETVQNYTESLSDSNLPMDLLSFDAQVSKVDELGVYFKTKAHLKKGARLRLVSSEFGQILEKDEVELIVTKTERLSDQEVYKIYGEYLHLDMGEITQFIHNLPSVSME